MGTILMIGGQEIFLVILVALVLFGADKIPDLARTVGKGMKEFKKASDDIMREINSHTSDFRKDIDDITNSVKQDMDKVTGAIMNQVNDAQSGIQQQINEVSNEINNTAGAVQQSWTNEQPRNFNDTSEQWMYGSDGDYAAPFDYREATQGYVYDESAPATGTTENQAAPQADNTPHNAGGGYDPYKDPESPYFDPNRT